jgi:hypothetical protein
LEVGKSSKKPLIKMPDEDYEKLMSNPHSNPFLNKHNKNMDAFPVINQQDIEAYNDLKSLHGKDAALDFMHQGNNLTSRSISEVMQEVTADTQCEPMASEVRQYLDEKGIEYGTGTYNRHVLGAHHQGYQLQVEIHDVTIRMFKEVLMPGLKEIARYNRRAVDTHIQFNDTQSVGTVMVRFTR